MKSVASHSKERGSAIVISLLAVLVLSMVGLMFVMQSNTETMISGHDMRAVQALYNAEAGTAEALALMSNPITALILTGETPLGPLLPGWGRYIVSEAGASLEDPNYDDTLDDGMDNNANLLIDEPGEHYPEVASVQSGDDIEYPWVKVNYKTNSGLLSFLYGDHDNNILTPPELNLSEGMPVLVITSNGARGSARRTVEVEAAKHPFVAVGAAFYGESDEYDFIGSQFLLSGQNHDPLIGLPLPGLEVPGLWTTGDPSAITGELTGEQVDNIVGAGGDPSVLAASVDLDIPAMIEQYSSMVQQSLPAGVYSDEVWGDLAGLSVVRIAGDMTIAGPVEGSGLLIIDGDLECTASFRWNGVVMVNGDVRFTGGNSTIYGSVMSGGSGTQVIGGQTQILYSALNLTRINIDLAHYTTLSWKEL